MVVEAPTDLRAAALAFFRDEDLPDELWWVEHLNVLQQRLFAVDIADKLKAALLTDDDRELRHAIGDWEATAEVMSSPEILKPRSRAVDEREYVSLDEFTSDAPWAERLEASGDQFFGDADLPDELWSVEHLTRAAAPVRSSTSPTAEARC